MLIDTRGHTDNALQQDIRYSCLQNERKNVARFYYFKPACHDHRVLDVNITFCYKLYHVVELANQEEFKHDWRTKYYISCVHACVLFLNLIIIASSLNSLLDSKSKD